MAVADDSVSSTICCESGRCEELTNTSSATRRCVAVHCEACRMVAIVSLFMVRLGERFNPRAILEQARIWRAASGVDVQVVHGARDGDDELPQVT